MLLCLINCELLHTESTLGCQKLLSREPYGSQTTRLVNLPNWFEIFCWRGSAKGHWCQLVILSWLPLSYIGVSESLSDPRELDQETLNAGWIVGSKHNDQHQAHHEYCFNHMLPIIHRVIKTRATTSPYTMLFLLLLLSISTNPLKNSCHKWYDCYQSHHNCYDACWIIHSVLHWSSL